MRAIATYLCTGRPSPCKACQNTDAECIFDETLDLRRKVAARRTLGELEHYRSLLYSLVDSLRSTDEDRIHHILETIRDSSSLDPIAVAIDAPNIDGHDTSADESKSKTGGDDTTVKPERLSGDAHSRITLEKLCDIPLFQVSAKPWVTVTNDDHLVSHLISLYFTWDHPLLQIVDQSIFLDHMRRNDTGSSFCSPLLVNSILAVASAVCLMSYAYVLFKFHCQGKRQASWMMLRQAVQLAQDFGMFEAPRTQHHEWKKMNAQMQYVASVTAHSIFILNSQMALICRRAANLQRPRFMLVLDNHLDDIAWAPYPHSNKIEYGRKSALLRYVMAALESLTAIVVEIQDLLFSKVLFLNIDEAWVLVSPLYSRLDQWPESLPTILRLDEGPMPQTLLVHIRYYHAIISLSDFLLDRGDVESAPNSTLTRQMRLLQVRSAKQIARCLRMHRELYGLRQFSGQVLEPICSSASVLMGALGDDGIEGPFVEVCRCLVAFSKRFPVGKAMIHEIESMARRSGIRLPPEAVAVLDHRELASSQWL
ncbi:C6 transcription factor [Aspergillus terreus]|uniref:C6 transcription factor n=1 Tax=Aspergillus terreus TaxID=33178 RepID=A0A5M3YPH8_ASPTE|nr:hypothetical protein ATETN484_0002047300 [Aspergillus terreus]GFF15329.1 C6 transcription factor [Aspergillus terreus]